MSPDIPFTRPVRIGEIGKGGLAFPIELNEEERNALATLLGVVTVNKLQAEVEVHLWRRNGARLEVKLEANLRQTCVVTLEDFDEDYSETFERSFAPAHDKIHAPRSDSELLLEVDSDDPPEVLEGDRFDVGEVIVEHLALSLDPYPRKPGVNFGDHQEGAAPSSPFDVLKQLKGENDQ